MKRWILAMSAMAQVSCCIARGAKVKTPKGERNIEDLRVGDAVVVVDPVSREQHVGLINAIRSAKRECALINTSRGSLKLTPSHPLFDSRRNEWAPAGDWILGLRSEFVHVDGDAHVVNVDRFVGIDDVFDLSIDHPLHTFVADGVVVHNKSPLGGLTEQPPCASSRGEACQCADGTVSQTTCNDFGRAQCSCATLSFSSNWDRGQGDDALRDNNAWELARCGEYPFALSVIDGADAGIGDGGTLRVTSGPMSCGYLRSKADWLRTLPGSVLVRFQEGERLDQSLLGFGVGTQMKLTLLGATSTDRGVQVFIGDTFDSENNRVRATANQPLRFDRWYLYDWQLEWSGASVRIWPAFFDLATGMQVLGAEQFISTSDAGFEVQQAEGSQLMIGTSLRTAESVTFFDQLTMQGAP